MQIRIATRKSPLALWQARHVAQRLQWAHPGLRVRLVKLTTTADRNPDVSLLSIGGKSLFTKELDRALLDDDADLAVHSMKDVTADLPVGLTLPVILERADPADALVTSGGADLSDLAPGARVGTSSLRRQAQLRAHRPDLSVVPLRGNVGTRLARLADGEFAALVLAQAGLVRLQLEVPRQRLSFAVCLPAVGQGAIGVQCREQDSAAMDLLAALDHPDTSACVRAERALARGLGGGCHLPIAALGQRQGGGVILRARVARPDGREMLEASASGPDPESLGLQVAEDLKQQGAERILAALAGAAKPA